MRVEMLSANFSEAATAMRMPRIVRMPYEILSFVSEAKTTSRGTEIAMTQPVVGTE